MTRNAASSAVFTHESFDDHEQVVFCRDRASGLNAIIAVHDTTLGPALGGCRMWDYADEASAIDDVLRLSRGMTFKNALAGLDFGGGKAVILGDARKHKSDALFEAFGEAVDRLGGRYITAEDVGISDADMELAARRTAHVRGIRATGLGDPSPFTAYGVFAGLKAAVRHKLGRNNLSGLTVAVQGIGSVGMNLARYARADGANLIVADINEEALETARRDLEAAVVPVDEIHGVKADVYAPCALGGALNEKSIPEIEATVVAGAANNQLREVADGMRLMKRGILYAPDYVINAGGVISIAPEGCTVTADAMKERVARIGDTLAGIFARSDAEAVPPGIIADRMAMERLREAREDRRRSA